MVNKKGYIKTLEAVIAIIMIVIVSYTLIARPTETPPDVPLIVKGAQKIMDQSIQLNETIRDLITLSQDSLSSPSPTGDTKQGDLEKGIKAIIDQYAPIGYDYTCVICTKPGTCLADFTPLDRSIYMTDVLVASSKEQQNVRIVRIWFWRKPTETDSTKPGYVPPLYLNKCYLKQ